MTESSEYLKRRSFSWSRGGLRLAPAKLELEDDKALRTNTFEFRSLPPGSYQVTATLLGADGHQLAYVRSQVNVVSSGISR